MTGRGLGAVAAFRDRFIFASRDVAHYFPGHMGRGLQQMEKRLKDVDCILEVHDGRIPISGRNPHFQEAINLRPHILVYNKMDLADLSHRQKIEKHLQETEGVTRFLYTNCKDQVHDSIKKRILPAVVETIESASRFHRQDVDTYNLMVVGVPNVGKSSLINAMRRIHLKKGKATQTGAVAGVTRSVLEKIKISDNPKIYVYDSPGIMMPKVNDIEVGMKLALCAALKDHLVGEDLIADYMLFWLNKHKKFKYVKYFGLPGPTDNILEFLAHVAKQNNLFMKQKALTGGYVHRPNFQQAAQKVLKAFRDGLLGQVNLDEDIITAESTENFSDNQQWNS